LIITSDTTGLAARDGAARRMLFSQYKRKIANAYCAADAKRKALQLIKVARLF